VSNNLKKRSLTHFDLAANRLVSKALCVKLTDVGNVLGAELGAALAFAEVLLDRE
jgi:hypothetical protein